MIVGQGSIGRRHATNFANYGWDVSVVSRRIIDHPKSYENLEACIEEGHPDFVLIANRTDQHFDTFMELKNLGFHGGVLIEKPIFEKTHVVPECTFKEVYVGYNLRFHPVLRAVKDLISNSEILGVNCYVGQYLPSWRPSADYRECYSAQKNLGGGVLRDLSHELDYLLWIFGNYSRVVSLGGKISDLEIGSEDHYHIIWQTEMGAQISLSLNYLDRNNQRVMTIHSNTRTLTADLVHNTLTINGETKSYPFEINNSYLSMIGCISQDDSSNRKNLCSFEEGLRVLELIELIEQSNRERNWISKV